MHVFGELFTSIHQYFPPFCTFIVRIGEKKLSILKKFKVKHTVQLTYSTNDH